MDRLSIPEVGQYHKAFGKAETTRPKESAYGWVVSDKMGKFELIHKDKINIDYTYQRDNIAKARILKICQSWSWVAFGCLIVGRRKDGTLWVIDGQHRLLAAKNRSDITTLPCLVFQIRSSQEEAKGFHSANTMRGPVDSYHRFRALLIAEDPTAVAVQNLVQEDGYEFVIKGTNRSSKSYKLNIVSTMYEAFKEDPLRATTIWKICVRICAKGETVTINLFRGLWAVDKHFAKTKVGVLAPDSEYVKKLASVGQDEILREIAKVRAYHGSGGEKADGQGIINVLNHRRRNRIPDMQV